MLNSKPCSLWALLQLYWLIAHITLYIICKTSNITLTRVLHVCCICFIWVLEGFYWMLQRCYMVLHVCYCYIYGMQELHETGVNKPICLIKLLLVLYLNVWLPYGIYCIYSCLLCKKSWWGLLHNKLRIGKGRVLTCILQGYEVYIFV